jgi:ornithine cyclodeaminase
MLVIEAAEIRARLTYDICIPLIRETMTRLSQGVTRQLLRSILPLEGERLFGVMPGALGGDQPFGAKLVSVFPQNVARGGQSHQGIVVLFDATTGAPVCVVDAGEVTAIRTAAASAVATEVLARPDARRLAIIGSGEQARNHALAIALVRSLEAVTIWARNPQRAEHCAQQVSRTLKIPVEVCDGAEEAVSEADIICTVTAAHEPVLLGRWVRAGAHVNVVGSSYAGPVEVDSELVVRSRFIADFREGVLAQGAEFLAAKAASLVADDHVVGEIGEVLLGRLAGRRTPAEITVYKSLGHIVQDLAVAQWLFASHRAT